MKLILKVEKILIILGFALLLLSIITQPSGYEIYNIGY